jgi:hypothetical protein
VPLGTIIGAAITAALGFQVILINGRGRSGSPRSAVSSARMRGAGFLTLATAFLAAGADAPLVAGLLMFVAVAVTGAAFVVAVRGQRAARRHADER